MRREFAVNLVLLVGINVLIKPVYLFAIDAGVQNAVGTFNYGRYGSWLSFAFLFGFLYDLGLQNYNSVTLSKSPELLRARLPILLSLKLALTALFAITVVTVAWLIGVKPEDWLLVWLAVLYLSALSLLQLLRTNVAAQGKYKYNSLISVADKLLLVIGLGAVLYIPSWREQLTVEYFFAAQIVALTVTIGLALAATSFTTKQRWFKWDTFEFTALLKRTLPFGLVLLLTTAFTRTDVVMVKWLSPLAEYEAGKYLGAYRLLDGVNMIGFMFASLLIPMLSKLVKDNQSAVLLLRQASGYMAALGIGFACYTSFYANDITQALYTDADASWATTLSWLMWAAASIGFTYVYGSYLLARHKVRELNYIFVAALALNILLNYLLIPSYGALGAAIATVTTQTLVALGEFVLCARLSGSATIGTHWYAVFVYSGVVLATAYCLKTFAVTAIIALVIQGLICLLTGLAVGLLADPRMLWQRLRA